MKIEYFTVRNFRKLKECRIDLTSDSTILVGANNSGKTSAMDALINFLDQDRWKNISTSDVTLSNWAELNDVGNDWLSDSESILSFEIWQNLLPSLDVWLDADTSQIHQVSHLIPSLDWNGGSLGIRVQLQPKDQKSLEKLYSEFRAAEQSAKEISSAIGGRGDDDGTFSLWPKSLHEFLNKKFHSYFSVSYYLLDPTTPTVIPGNSAPLENKPFDGLFRVHVINAQRGFSDSNSEEPNKHKLAEQLRSYYDKHLNPNDTPSNEDVSALKAIHSAQQTFDSSLERSFTPALEDLREMNYPGFQNPTIHLTSQLKPVDSLAHQSGIQFSIPQQLDAELDPELLRLPESYNGLGYQNLISMLFQLVRFRDEWKRAGKAHKVDDTIEPLQLVLIEEPEAHLHAQAQQVFIKKAYDILRKGVPEQLVSQLVISTHSSHIAYESEFTSLRYFKRKAASNACPIPTAEVASLSKVFGDDEATLKFASRYLKTTHCDLFFADAAILVEGQAEKMLIPHFIEHHYKKLNRSYTSILEIGGSHAHRLKPLIEALGIYTLIITDLDSIEADSPSKVQPKLNNGYRCGNDTIKKWHPRKEDQDELLRLPEAEKVTPNGVIRVAYQCPFTIKFNGVDEEAIPYTFEDALALSNVQLFKDHTSNAVGMLKKMCSAASQADFTTASNDMYRALEGVKAKMALDILYDIEPSNLIAPKYVADGLEWIEEQLDQDQTVSASTIIPLSEEVTL